MDYDMAIAELKSRQAATDAAVAKLDERVTKHDEIIEFLMGSVATKEDFAGLRGDLRERDEIAAERMDYYRDRLLEMEKKHAADLANRAEQTTANEGKFNRRMSWAMVIMFVGELVLGWLGLHHGK
jgi:hypothetical protein